MLGPDGSSAEPMPMPAALLIAVAVARATRVARFMDSSGSMGRLGRACRRSEPRMVERADEFCKPEKKSRFRRR
jgi:hypothetical protein